MEEKRGWYFTMATLFIRSGSEGMDREPRLMWGGGLWSGTPVAVRGRGGSAHPTPGLPQTPRGGPGADADSHVSLVAAGWMASSWSWAARSRGGCQPSTARWPCSGRSSSPRTPTTEVGVLVMASTYSPCPVADRSACRRDCPQLWHWLLSPVPVSLPCLLSHMLSVCPWLHL